MPIQNLNGVGRNNGRKIEGEIYTHGIASVQHADIGFTGKSYSSPFTSSSKPPLGEHFLTATQPQLPALKVEAPGDVVKLQDFVKVHPNEKGTFFSTNKVRPIISRVGGPSKHADTPANPNAIRLRTVNRPVRRPNFTTEHMAPLGFLRGAGTLKGLANQDNQRVSRWTHTERGVVK